MLTAYQLGQALAKNAGINRLDDTLNVFEGNKKTYDTISPKDKSLRVPVLNRRSAQDIVDAMAAVSKYDSLKNVRVGLGANPLENYSKRLQENPRVWNIIKAMSPETDDPLGGLSPQQLGDFYLYHSHDVNLPSKSPGVLVHELGHAVDFNEHPADSYIRGLIGGAYRKYAPTVWKEHAAWRKGKDRFLQGAAEKELDPKFVQDTLQSIQQTKPVGLGSYWGGALGGLTGGALGGIAALGIGASTNRYPIGLPLITSALGGGLGILAGTGLGEWLGHAKQRASEKERLKHLKTYASVYAKRHDMSENQALELLLSKLKNKLKQVA